MSRSTSADLRPDEMADLPKLSFHWGSSGSATVLSATFEMKSVEHVEVDQDLGVYTELALSWRPVESSPGGAADGEAGYVFRIGEQHTIDFQTGERTKNPELEIEFLVDERGQFVEVCNMDSLVQASMKLMHTEMGSEVAAGLEASADQQHAFIRNLLFETARARWHTWVEIWTELPRDPLFLLQHEMMLPAGPSKSFGKELYPLSIVSTYDVEDLKSNYIAALQATVADGVEPRVDFKHAEHRQQLEGTIERETCRPHILTTYESKILSCEAYLVRGAGGSGNGGTAASADAAAGAVVEDHLPRSLFFQKRLTKTLFLWSDVPDMLKEREALWRSEYVQFHQFCAALYRDAQESAVDESSDSADVSTPNAAGAGVEEDDGSLQVSLHSSDASVESAPEANASS